METLFKEKSYDDKDPNKIEEEVFRAYYEIVDEDHTVYYEFLLNSI